MKLTSDASPRHDVAHTLRYNQLSGAHIPGEIPAVPEHPLETWRRRHMQDNARRPSLELGRKRHRERTPVAGPLDPERDGPEFGGHVFESRRSACLEPGERHQAQEVELPFGDLV